MRSSATRKARRLDWIGGASVRRCGGRRKVSRCGGAVCGCVQMNRSAAAAAPRSAGSVRFGSALLGPESAPIAAAQVNCYALSQLTACRCDACDCTQHTLQLAANVPSPWLRRARCDVLIFGDSRSQLTQLGARAVACASPARGSHQEVQQQSEAQCSRAGPRTAGAGTEKKRAGGASRGAVERAGASPSPGRVWRAIRRALAKARGL